MSGAMYVSMKAPPPGARTPRDICWTSSRPCGLRTRCSSAAKPAVLLVADVLSHLDGGDRLVLTAFDIAVVTQLDVDQVVEATLAHAGEDGVALFAGEGHGRHLDLVVFGRVQGECTPTAADVEQPRSWPQPQLAADQFQLVALRFAQAVFGVLTCPVGAGVRHRRIEQQLVELVGQVVVVADGRAVATGGVASTPQPRAPRGAGGRGPRAPSRAAVRAAAAICAAPGLGAAACGLCHRVRSPSPRSPSMSRSPAM